jgi:uncharacterized protein YbaR (Trm112 family)
VGTGQPDAAGDTDLPDAGPLSGSELDEKLLAILVCPQDRGPLLYVDDCLYNPRLRRKYRIEDGIPVLLIDEAVAVDDDEHRRLVAAAGGS